MTTREALMSVVAMLDDEQVARLLGYADMLAQDGRSANGAVEDPGLGGGPEDELSSLVPRAGFAPGSGLWDIVGIIDDGHTDVSTNKHTYLAEGFAVPTHPRTDEALRDELSDVEPVLSFAPDSPLWDLVGFIKDDGPADMSTNKDTYLAEAYADLHEG